MIMVHKTLILATAMGMAAGWAAAYSPAMADDACWDTRRVIVDPDGTRHDFPFSNFFGALPAEVARCERQGNTVLAELGKVRADPSLLDKEKQTGHVYYKNLLDCCKGWTGYRCQHYPEPPNNPGGYGSTQLEGYIGPVSGCADPLPKGGTGEVLKQAQPPSSEPLPQGGTKKFFKP